MVRLLGAIALDFFNCSVQVAKKWKGEISPKCFGDVAAEFVDESQHLAGFRFGAFAGQSKSDRVLIHSSGPSCSNTRAKRHG